MSDVVGAVLAGGASRRMGTDKARLEVEGVALARRVATALHAGGCDSVLLVGGADRPIDGPTGALPIGHVADRWPGEGPLGGLATAVADLPASVDAIVVVAGCDHPDLAPELVRRLIGALVDAGPEVLGAVPVTEDGRRQPLPSAWRAQAGPALVALVAAGERRAAAASSAGTVVEVEAATRELVDLDRPDDLERWIARTAARAEASPYTAAVDVPEIDIAEAARRIEAGTPVVDVRELDEYLDGHVPGAPLISLATVPDHLDQFPTEGEVLIICKVGGRSRNAAEYLRAQGIDAVNIAGGTMAWIEAGHQVVEGEEAGT